MSDGKPVRISLPPQFTRRLPDTTITFKGEAHSNSHYEPGTAVDRAIRNHRNHYSTSQFHHLNIELCYGSRSLARSPVRDRDFSSFIQRDILPAPKQRYCSLNPDFEPNSCHGSDIAPFRFAKHFLHNCNAIQKAVATARVPILGNFAS